MQIEYETGETRDACGFKPQARSKDHWRERMCRIEFAVENFVPQTRPANFAAQFNSQPIFFEQTSFTSNYQRGAIAKRDKPDSQHASINLFRQTHDHFDRPSCAIRAIATSGRQQNCSMISIVS